MRSIRNSPPPNLILNSYWLPLSKNLFALIDSDDIKKVSKWLWSALIRKGPYSPYAFRRENERTIYLHRFIMDCPEGMEVDHIDGNGLNCKKSNMRICTHSENQYNYRKTSSNTSSKFKGVVLKRGRWASRIKKDGRTIFIGSFSSEREAALAYNEMAKKLFGSFSNLNVVQK